MAPVEIDTIPMDIMAPVKYMKVVDKAFELPFITSVYDEITKMAAPISPSFCRELYDHHHTHDRD